MRGIKMFNVPKLRFREFEGEWVEKRYGDIYSFYSTNSLSRDKLNYEDGEVKNIHYGDIHTKFSTIFDIEKESVPFINRAVNLAKIKDTSYCKEGDLVIADASEDYADIGKTVELKKLDNQKLLAGLHTFLARPNSNKITLGFMGYLLQSWKIRKQVMTIAQGTKVLSLSTSRLKQVKLNLPQKQEQKKIATYLTSIDKKIEQLNQKRTLLESYKKGVMQKIFSQEIRFSPTLVPTLSVGTSSGFDDWEEKKLGEISTLTSSKRVYLSDYTKTGIPFYRGKEISELKLGITPKDILYISEEIYEEYKFKYGVPQINDLLITAVGTLGNVLKIKKNKSLYFGA